MTQPLPPDPWTRATRSGAPEYYNPYSGKWSRNRGYTQRLQRGYRRGLSQSEARGHAATAAGTESQRRRQRTLERTGMTPTEAFGIGFRQRYGFSYSYWRRLRRLYINEINKRSSPSGQIKPSHISDVIQMFRLVGGDMYRPELRTWEAWTEVHLGERMWALILYQEEGDTAYGAFNFSRRNNLYPIVFYYYH